MSTVRPLTDADREAVLTLITAHFAEERSYEVPENDECAGTYVRVAEREGKPVGVMALTTYDSRERVREAMHLVDTVEGVPSASTYGLVHAGYVAPAHTGTGIGSRLLERLHEIGDTNGVEVFVADAWFHGGPDSPADLLTTHGYDVVSTDSIAGHADGPCPKCGTPCACEAALTVRAPTPE
jgi:GNAT superfamily N-acetyltransferase